jgi:hypothetical protein
MDMNIWTCMKLGISNSLDQLNWMLHSYSFRAFLLCLSTSLGHLSVELRHSRIFLQGCLHGFIQFTILMRLVTSPHLICASVPTRYKIFLHKHRISMNWYSNLSLNVVYMDALTCQYFIWVKCMPTHTDIQIYSVLLNWNKFRGSQYCSQEMLALLPRVCGKEDVYRSYYYTKTSRSVVCQNAYYNCIENCLRSWSVSMLPF